MIQLKAAVVASAVMVALVLVLSLLCLQQHSLADNADNAPLAHVPAALGKTDHAGKWGCQQEEFSLCFVLL